ncbi:MAG: hypothetical protein ACI4B3_05140 [Prevotella sp.]
MRNLLILSLFLLYALPIIAIDRYTVSIEMNRGGITGIAVLNDDSVSTVGSFINEFGIKAFDFCYDKRRRKVKLMNVMKMMDKWYVRKVLRHDLLLLLEKREAGEPMRLTNQRHHIIYIFEPLVPEGEIMN